MNSSGVNSTSPYTYGTFLAYLGLSNWQFILILLALCLLYSFFKLFLQMGSLRNPQLFQRSYGQFKIVYISFQGSYDAIGTIYEQACEDFDMVFKMSHYFVIYYDRPVTFKEQCRAIIGVIAERIQQSKIELFRSKFPAYKTSLLPSSSYLSCRQPYISDISPIMVIGTVYPRLQARLGTRSKWPIIEVYRQKDKDPHIEVMVPIENVEEFMIWYEPTAYTKVHSKKQ